MINTSSQEYIEFIKRLELKLYFMEIEDQLSKDSQIIKDLK